MQFPAWLWANDPTYQVICGTYAHKLTVRDAVRGRDLITSPWYCETFQPDWELKDDANEKDLYYNTRTGFRCSVSVTGQGTGYRGNGVIYDDILSRDQAHSEAERVRACEWVKQTMSSRRNDLSKDWEVAIGQRLHESDPYGEMIQSGKYELLCLPTEYDPSRRSVTKIGWSDPRTVENELLFPALFPPKVVDQCKIDLGSYGWSGQHQQSPSPGEGGILKRHWWRYWKPAGMKLPPVTVKIPGGDLYQIEAIDLPERFDTQLQSWDMAFKDTKHSDYVVGQVHAGLGSKRFVLDQVRDRLDLPKTMAAVRALSFKWPDATAKLVEDKANGPAVVQSLRNELTGLIEVNPEGGKESRAHGVSPEAEAGNWHLPHPLIADWVTGFIDECAAFPNASHDDQVDSWSQGGLRMRRMRLSVVEDIRDATEMAKVAKVGDMAKPVTAPQTVRCPRCESLSVVRISGMLRCNSCTHSWSASAPVKPGISPTQMRKAV